MTVLETSRPYYRPGVYVGELAQPQVSATTAFSRIPCYVGKGDTNLLVQDQQVTRGYINDEALTFTKVAPFRATLKYKAAGSKDTAKLITGDGAVVDSRTWSFVADENGKFIAIEVSSATYQPTATYILSYQSADPNAFDDTGIANIEKVLQIGLRADSNDFSSSDYSLETKIGDFAIGAPIYNVTENKGSGDLPLVHPSSAYQGPTRSFDFAVEVSQVLDQPAIVSAVPGTGNTGTGLPSIDVTNWSGETDTVYSMLVSDKSTDGNTLTFQWSRDNPSGSGELTVRLGFESNVALFDGLVGDFGDLTRYVKGDAFVYTIGQRQAPQLLVSWVAEDPNGGAGEFTVTPLNRAKVTWTQGMFLVFGADLSKYVEGDCFTMTCTSTGRIIWNYDLVGSQNVATGDISFDQTGAITGTRRAYYLALSETQVQSVTAVTQVNKDGSELVLQPSKYSHIDGTGYVVLGTTAPADTVVRYRVDYTYTNSPNYGQTYYIDAQATKPDSAYNNVLFLTSGNYLQFCGYPTPDNHLGIMADLAFNVVKLTQIAVVQVKNADRSGVYSNADYANAINALPQSSKFSDAIVLGNVASIGPLMAELNRRNDPFERAECLGWFGYPVNTPVGTSQQAEGTLTYYGGVVMQVGASSNAHGCQISVANTWGKRTITQYNGVQVQVTLDGSFLAGVAAAMTAAFANSWNTLLRQEFPGFDEVQAFNDTDLKIFGSYGWIILDYNGTTTTVLDAVTHDNFAPNYRQINAMTQKQYMNHVVRDQLDAAVIGIVPESQEDGEQLIRTALVGILADLVAKGQLGKYQDETTGKSRSIDPSQDVNVKRSDTDYTKYYTAWSCWLRYNIARVNGLYTVDTNQLAM